MKRRKFIAFTMIISVLIGLTVLIYEVIDDYKMETRYASSAVQADSGEVGTLWEKNKYELLKLNEKYYGNLSEQQKLDVLAVVLQIEMKHLGINGEIKLASQSLSEILTGYYSHEDKLIVLNTSTLQNAEESVETILHEARHAMQHAAVDALHKLNLNEKDSELLYFQTLYDWQYEIENYIGEEDIIGWYSQKIEQDAIDYAEEWSKHYLNYIRPQ